MLCSHRLIILYKGLSRRHLQKGLQLVGQAVIQHGRGTVEFKFGARASTNDVYCRTCKNGQWSTKKLQSFSIGNLSILGWDTLIGPLPIWPKFSIFDQKSRHLEIFRQQKKG
jgi:hypothetical protein